MYLTFSEFLLLEARYPGNIGMMEMIKFYQVASDEEKAKLKKLIASGRQEEVWKFLQQVTKVRLN